MTANEREDPGEAVPSDFALRFGRNLRRVRRRAGLSQEELAIRASLHRTAISLLECGLRVARVDTLIKLAGALEAEPEVLLEGLRWQPGALQSGRFERTEPLPCRRR